MNAHFWKHTFKGRLLISIIAGTLFAFVVSEGAFFMLRDTSDHTPQHIELVIPAGTAARVAAGQPVPSIPSDLSFVIGDTLVVKNDDDVAHQLGPVWVPPGASASLNLDEANKFSYACTFQTSRNLGLDVRSRVTWATRAQAFLMVGPPMIALIAIYSLLVWPLKPRKATT